MANKKPGQPGSDSAEQAMNRVLAAERDAAQAIADCEAVARDTVQAARQRANRITARTDERITLLKMRCAKQITATLRQLARAQQADSGKSGAPLNDDSINACLEALAAALTGSVDKKDPGQ